MINYREASALDLDEIAIVHRDTRLACLTFLADPHPYTLAQDHNFFRERIFPKSNLLAGFDGDQMVAYLAHSPGWVEHLYVRKEHHGKGIGTKLLNTAKEQQAELRLWVFQKNQNSRRFYERQDFICESLHDGSNNEEHEPDAVYVWRR